MAEVVGDLAVAVEGLHQDLLLVDRDVGVAHTEAGDIGPGAHVALTM